MADEPLIEVNGPVDLEAGLADLYAKEMQAELAKLPPASEAEQWLANHVAKQMVQDFIRGEGKAPPGILETKP